MDDKTYRFDDLIGNTVNIGLLKRSIAYGTFKQFSIFAGTLGTGKSTCAQITAMALTCDSADNGQPCGKCRKCLANQKALATTGESSWIKVINCGRIEDRASFNKTLDEIFGLDGGTQVRVFILEEAHALARIDRSQVALLAEIDRMPANTFIIMCTTKAGDLIEELKSRAVIYQFNRLSDSESRLLATKIIEESKIVVDDVVVNIIIKSSRGVPRALINAIDFVQENHVTSDELRGFLQVVDDAQILQLFESMGSTQIGIFLQCIESILRAVSPSDFLEGIKSFVVQAAFLTEGGITGTFSRKEKKAVRSIFTKKVLRRLISVLDRHSYKISEDDLRMLLFHMRLIVQERSAEDVVLESEQVAKYEKLQAESLVSEVKQAEVDTPGRGLTKLSVSSLNVF